MCICIDQSICHFIIDWRCIIDSTMRHIVFFYYFLVWWSYRVMMKLISISSNANWWRWNAQPWTFRMDIAIFDAHFFHAIFAFIHWFLFFVLCNYCGGLPHISHNLEIKDKKTSRNSVFVFRFRVFLARPRLRICPCTLSNRSACRNISIISQSASYINRIAKQLFEVIVIRVE